MELRSAHSRMLFFGFSIFPQTLFQLWRASLGIPCTSSTCVWPSFSSTPSSGWSPINPNTSSNITASQHPLQTSSWVSRASFTPVLIHDFGFLWTISLFGASEACSGLCCHILRKLFKDANWCDQVGGNKCFMSQLWWNFHAPSNSMCIYASRDQPL